MGLIGGSYSAILNKSESIAERKYRYIVSTASERLFLSGACSWLLLLLILILYHCPRTAFIYLFNYQAGYVYARVRGGRTYLDAVGFYCCCTAAPSPSPRSHGLNKKRTEIGGRFASPHFRRASCARECAIVRIVSPGTREA